jgi:hypothetical protein
VRPIVVVISQSLRVKEMPRSVRVVDEHSVARWLAAQPVTLTPAWVDSLYLWARRDSTWRDAQSGG